jgi:hypothetical protein
MVYKRGDRIKTDDANRWNEGLGAYAYRPGMLQDVGPSITADRDDRNRVVIEPAQAMAAYSVMKGQSLLGIHATSGRPRFSASNTQDQAVADGSNTFYLTCGKSPIAAGGSGFGNIIREGEWHWILSDASVQGYCGLAINSSQLSMHYPGFVAAGTSNVDGVNLALATMLSNQSYKVKTKVAMTSNAYSRCYMCRAIAGGWSDTNLEVDVWQPFTGTTPADKYLYASYVNGRLVNFLESCT